MIDLSQYGTCTLDDDGCTTCGDAAVPVRVRSCTGTTARCEDRTGQEATISTDFVDDVRPGDVLLVHASVALSRIRPGA
jgi:hydrogenase expression/formation protein HypC